jgi:hypothetical protein
MEIEVWDGWLMVGDGVDEVWGMEGMMFEEELAIVPFAFMSALISLTFLASTSKLFLLSSLLALSSSTRFLMFSIPSRNVVVSIVEV